MSVAASTGSDACIYDSNLDGKLGIVNLLSKKINPTSHELTSNSYFSFSTWSITFELTGLLLSKYFFNLGYSVPEPTIKINDFELFSFLSKHSIIKSIPWGLPRLPP